MENINCLLLSHSQIFGKHEVYQPSIDIAFPNAIYNCCLIYELWIDIAFQNISTAFQIFDLCIPMSGEHEKYQLLIVIAFSKYFMQCIPMSE